MDESRPTRSAGHGTLDLRWRQRADNAHVRMLEALVRTYAPRAVRSVAVVGNAPLEPSRERAEAIDACDLVVRVNGFGLDEDAHAPCVGRRVEAVLFTRGIRPTPWFFAGYRRRAYLLLEPARMHWEPEEWPDWWPEDLGAVTISNRDVAVPLAHALGLDAEHDGHWATTGTTAVWLACVLFPEAEVRIAGFSALRDPHQTAWPHAYDIPTSIGPEHNLEAEAAFLRTLAENGTIAELA